MNILGVDYSLAFVNLFFLICMLLFIVGVMFYLRKDKALPYNINLLSFAIMIIFIITIVFIIFYTDFFPGCNK